MTAELNRKYFDSCFDRTYDVEFAFNPSMSDFRRKLRKEGSASKPILFLYSKQMYMSRYFPEFQNVLKQYEGMFDIFYTDDPEEAKKYLYIGEFPEVLPVAVIFDPLDRKPLDGAVAEKPKFSESYPKKYRNLIFMNKIEKDLKKLLDDYLDEKSEHFYTSKKMRHDTRVKTICGDSFENEIMKNPAITQCIVEVFKPDCPSCAYNGKIFNIFSRKLEKHGFDLPCFRLCIDNNVPFLGNFGYSPIYMYVRKEGDKIVEIKTLN